MKTQTLKTTAQGNEYVEVDRFDAETGLAPLPKVWHLCLHGRAVKRFLDHKEGTKALGAAEGRGWALASVHPDQPKP